MKESIRLQRDREKLIALGLPPELAAQAVRKDESASITESEAALAYLDGGTQHYVERRCKKCNSIDLQIIYREFVEKKCKQCDQVFAVNTIHCSYCSTACRRKSLEAIGISWNPEKPEVEKWQGNIPLVVPPAAYPLLKSRRLELNEIQATPL